MKPSAPLQEKIAGREFWILDYFFDLPVQHDMNEKQNGKSDQWQGLIQVGIFQQGDDVKEDHYQGQEPGEQARIAIYVGGFLGRFK